MAKKLTRLLLTDVETAEAPGRIARLCPAVGGLGAAPRVQLPETRATDERPARLLRIDRREVDALIKKRAALL